MNLGDKKHVISVRLDDSLFDFVSSSASEMGMKPGDFIRALLRVGLSMSKSPAYEQLNKAGSEVIDAGIDEANKVFGDK